MRYNWESECVIIARPGVGEAVQETALLVIILITHVRWKLGCPDLHTIQLNKFLFEKVMFGYYMDQNPKEGFHILNFEAALHIFSVWGGNN